jgi:Hemin uptake protein hemP.
LCRWERAYRCGGCRRRQRIAPRRLQQRRRALLHLAEHRPPPGNKRVHIAHNGGVYQLQATRQGKLILTK